jgi:amino acid adenylation domain-containing protein
MTHASSPRADRLDGLLAASAAAAPERIAVIDGAVRLTYGELDRRVDALTGTLAVHGLGRGSAVGALLPKGHGAVAAIHAVLRAGGIVAPLAPADPPARLARMAAWAGLDALVVPSDGIDRGEAVAAELRAWGAGNRGGGAVALGDGLALLPLGLPRNWSAPDGGYVLFTSGSTGWPKGVLLDHGNVLHFVRWAVRCLGIGRDDVLGSHAALTFDLSTLDVFGAMLAGACVTLMPEVLAAFPRDVVDWLAAQRVTVFYTVPTLYQRLVEAGADGTALPALRVLPFAGEPYPAAALERLVRAFPDRRIANLYGPTETNVCTWAEIPPGWRAADGLGVGRAIDGLWVGLLADDGTVVRGPGEVGEVAVAGPAVFRGYLVEGRIVDPTVPVPGGPARVYRTGDLGHTDAEGALWLSGRRDHQVKVRGHRIDLADVEAAAGEVEGVGSCAAHVRPGPDGDVLVLVATTTDPVPETTLRAGLAARLPRRMLPDEIRFVADLPLTDRGKVDRAALAVLHDTTAG